MIEIATEDVMRIQLYTKQTVVGGEMTIEKAIEILQRDRFDNPFYHLLDFQDAIDLSIEALKDVLKDRQGTFTILLPGETEE